MAAPFWILLFAAYAVAAVGLTVLDASGGRYAQLSQVSLVTVQASDDTRALGAAQMAAVYRAESGAPFASLPPGATVRIVWPDGSSEYVVVTNPAASDGTATIPGTRQTRDGAPVGTAVPARPDAPASGALHLRD